MGELELPQWAAVVKPGQTLIVGLAAGENATEYMEQFQHARELLPEGVGVIFIEGVASLAVAEE